MSIVKKAVAESKDVARLAVDAAKMELIESLTPAIQKIIDSQLRHGVLGEDTDRLRRAADGHGESDFEEGIDMAKNRVESVASLFPGVNESEGKNSVKDDDGYDDIGLTHEAFDDDGHADMKAEASGDEMDESADDGDGMDEQMEISESELAAMYAEALQLEVEVTKGFRDMEKPHDVGPPGKWAKYESDPSNLATYHKSEAEWDNVYPDDRKDFIPKESIRRLVKQGIRENQQLTERNAKLTEMVKAMHGKLKEMNLLNTKILHVNKFMTAHRLTAEQKRSVIESIDKGKTVNEVKRISSILESSFGATGAISESRKPHANAQKKRSTGAPKTEVLRESAGKEEGRGYGRWQQLAGLNKIVSG
jgi:hypothetical protein